MSTNKVKIFISYKDKHKIIKSNILQPIQTGRAIAEEVFEDMVGDDTGDNISVSNPKYNELSAQYWVWKNLNKVGNPDYVGFMHYRRHFLFNSSINLEDRLPWYPGMPIFRFEYMDDDYLKNLSDENINNVIEDNSDCIVFKPYNINYFGKNDLYIREHYISTIPGAKRINWDVFYSVILEIYPDYAETFNEFMYGNEVICCNMFIMKKALFMQYSEFCFNILGEVDKRIDSSSYDDQELRFLGYLGEYLLTIFIKHMQKTTNSKIKFLNGSLIIKPDGERVKSVKPQKKSLKFYQKIINIIIENNHKTLYLFGIKIKFKQNKKMSDEYKLLLSLSNKISKLQEQANLTQKQTDILLDKVSELQQELIVNLKRKV